MGDGKPTTTIRHGKNTIIVHRPDLSPEERDRRMKQIEKAASNLLLAVMKIERKKNE